MQIDTRLLRQFIAIYERRSIGRAALELNLTQPAVSKALQRLEADLGVTLFDRVPLGLVPTVFADRLFENARRVEAELRAAVLEIKELQGLGTGQVVVGAAPGVLSAILPRAVEALLAQRPGLEIVVREGTPNAQLAGTARGEFDFVIGENPPDMDDTNLDSTFLLEDQVVVYCRPLHPLARKRSTVRLKDLAGQRWALTDQTEALRRRLFAAFAKATLPPPASPIRTNSLVHLRAVLLGGDYLTLVSRQIYAAEEKLGLLRALAVPETSWTRRISLTARRGITLSPAARALIAEIRKIAAE